MEYRKLGNSDIDVSVISLGTWAMGADSNWGAADDKESVYVIRTALEKGINLVDTAPAYGMGHSEKVVGKAIKEHRREYVLATKCGLVWGNEEGSYFSQRDGTIIRRNLSPESIRRQLENSLRRLRTDYIDLYITHWQAESPFAVPIEETMGCLNELKKEGKIRAIGISNVTADHVSRYLDCGNVDLVQEKYSLLDRTTEKNGVKELCDRFNITFQAYSPLERGILAGNKNTGGNARRGIKWYQEEAYIQVNEMLSDFQALCKKYSTSLAGLILAWTKQVSPNMNVLCGARSENHLSSNCEGGEIILSENDRRMMNQKAIQILEENV